MLIHVQPADSLYDHLLAVAGVPLTPAYLERLATVNNVPLADLVRLLPVDRQVQLADPEAPADGTEEEEELDAAALVVRVYCV